MNRALGMPRSKFYQQWISLMMNVAISAQGTDWNAPVETHFGRARYLLIVDSETGRITVHDNIKNLNELQGAGIRSAQTLVNLGAQVLLTGSIGPKALETLRAAGVDGLSQ
jgi:predicted Fe-Mo cluster-binding NifX family protein